MIEVSHYTIDGREGTIPDSWLDKSGRLDLRKVQAAIDFLDTVEVEEDRVASNDDPHRIAEWSISRSPSNNPLADLLSQRDNSKNEQDLCDRLVGGGKIVPITKPIEAGVDRYSSRVIGANRTMCFSDWPYVWRSESKKLRTSSRR